MKTFWGWRYKQLPDGTVIWNLPANQTHLTTPGSALLFPSLCAPTAALSPPTHPSNPQRCGDPTVMMPRRKTTRDQDRAQRRTAERTQNHKIRQARRTAWDDICFGARTPTSDDDDPPPF